MLEMVGQRRSWHLHALLNVTNRHAHVPGLDQNTHNLQTGLIAKLSKHVRCFSEFQRYHHDSLCNEREAGIVEIANRGRTAQPKQQVEDKHGPAHQCKNRDGRWN